ncbi:MAG: hypothetical protein CME25_10535 [Gemmatimonadetes bacterium]|nr:hypothetical protein [Gemmatimonadota bacterium]
MREVLIIVVFYLMPSASVVQAAEVVLDSLALRADSLAAILAEQPPEEQLEELGDSLFVPSSGRAHIIRDRYGVPHIYGETDADVAFGFGYAQAQDHLISMLLSYRGAAGRLSEILGESALESDTKVLLWRIKGVAGERYGTIPKDTRDLIGGFVSGVNHYIDVYEEVLPEWVETITGTDVVALSRWLMLLFAETTGASELAKKGLEPTLKWPVGSNQWAVGGARSSTGSPIFVMDLHLPWVMPFHLYEAHLVSREGMNVAGATFFGLPVIAVGHNDQIAWSMTLNETDVFDMFEEKLDQANSRRYVYEREKERMTANRVKIKVWKGDTTYDVKRELLYTHHGPVLKSVEGWAYSARSSMMDIVGTLAQLYAMNKAVDVEAFKRILSNLEVPLFNVMYADRQNELFYVYNTRTPQRAGTFDWRSPVPGWASETEWGRIIPFDRLPQVSNPIAGFMQNCNVAPDLITMDTDLNPDDYPQILGWGTFNDRGRRTMARLSTQSDVSLEDMQRLARDTYLIAAEELKGTILAAYNHSWHEIYDPAGILASAVEVLRNWDNRATAESKGALLFCIWKTRFDPLILQIPADQRSDNQVRERLALEALRMATEFLVSTYGRVDVPWGEVHVLERGEALFPSSGSPPQTSALHTTWSKMGDDGLYRVTGGSAFTMVVDLSPDMKAFSIVPFGSSENVNSKHFSDQAPIYGAGAFKRTRLTQDEVYFDITAVDQVPLNIEEAEIEAYRAVWKRDRVLMEKADTTDVN